MVRKGASSRLRDHRQPERGGKVAHSPQDRQRLEPESSGPETRRQRSPGITRRAKRVPWHHRGAGAEGFGRHGRIPDHPGGREAARTGVSVNRTRGDDTKVGPPATLQPRARKCPPRGGRGLRGVSQRFYLRARSPRSPRNSGLQHGTAPGSRGR